MLSSKVAYAKLINFSKPHIFTYVHSRESDHFQLKHSADKKHLIDYLRMDDIIEEHYPPIVVTLENSEEKKRNLSEFVDPFKVL